MKILTKCAHCTLGLLIWFSSKPETGCGIFLAQAIDPSEAGLTDYESDSSVSGDELEGDVEVDVIEIEVSFPEATMLQPLDQVTFMPPNTTEQYQVVEGINTSHEEVNDNEIEGSYRKLTERRLAEAVQVYVPSVPASYLQDDDWSCGIQSTTRVLRAYGFSVSYVQQRSRIGYLPLTIPIDPCLGTGFSCEYSFTIENRLVGMGRPPPDLASELRRLGYSSWKDESGSNMSRMKQLLDQGRPLVVLIRVNDVARADLCHDFGGFIGRQCVYSVTFPGLHYVTVIGYNDEGFQYVDTEDNVINTYTYNHFDNIWNFKGWNTGLVYKMYSNIGAKPRSFLYYDRKLSAPTPGCECSCCGSGGGPAFCLVPCGCTCNVPPSHVVKLRVQNDCSKRVLFDAWFRSVSPSYYNSAFSDSPSLREGEWQWSRSSGDLWWGVNSGSNVYYENTNTDSYYYGAIETTTGASWGGSDLYRIKGETRYGLRKRSVSTLGTTSQVTLTCPSLPTERFRFHIRNSCEWYGDLRVILYYYDADTLTWKTSAYIIADDEKAYFVAKSRSRYIYYYATDVTTGSVEWKGSDYTVTWGGQSYSLRQVDMGGTFRKYTRSLTCSCTPSNCIWGSWGSWSSCFYSSEIGRTVRYRTRSHSKERNVCGDECSGPSVEWEGCLISPAPTPGPTPNPTPFPTTLAPLAPGSTRSPTTEPLIEPTETPRPVDPTRPPPPSLVFTDSSASHAGSNWSLVNSSLCALAVLMTLRLILPST